MIENEKKGNLEKSISFLLAEHRTLSFRRTAELVAFRLILFLLLLIAILFKANTVLLFLIACVSLVIGVIWYSAMKVLSRSQHSLEKGIMDYSLGDHEDSVTKIYVDWRYEDWRQANLMRLLSFEPFIWVILTILIVSIRIILE